MAELGFLDLGNKLVVLDVNNSKGSAFRLVVVYAPDWAMMARFHETSQNILWDVLLLIEY